MEQINYDDIQLPKKVSDILEYDLWSLQHVAAGMVRTVVNPVKFSAFTSIFIHQGSAEADINLLTHKIQGPCIVNINAGDIVLPREISDDFDASFAVLSRRMTDALVGLMKDSSIFTVIHTHPVVEIDENDVVALARLYDDIQALSTDSTLLFPFETALFTLASYFFRYSSKYYEKFRREIAPSVQNRTTDRFIQLVQKHFRTERFLEFYAGKLEISPKHLSRTIKSQTGASPVDWINRYIILEAKVMLRSSNLNIQQIADELHFPSQSFFGKYFKKATGMTPKEYRNGLS
ncbi:helix-turn-helix transcriptional regulator [bacterium]|nr:helix-turn-helix transcriptional regulator [Bacteroides sp.]MBD5386243.1 helix-turn-helix transcriptional regulator [bacterium]